MKSKLIFFLFSILCLYHLELHSQETCKVLKQEIAGKYEGKCKKGLAHGKGVAEGLDKYDGQFKNGLPHGKGKYTWATGEVYDGNWKEGKREGEGKYFFKKNGADSVKIGIWGNDVYLRKILPSPYKVLSVNSVTRYSVRRINDGSRVIFYWMQNGSSNTNVSNVSFSSTTGNSYSLGAGQGYENVVFPVTCKVNYTTPNSLKTIEINSSFEVEIREPGNWEIILNN